MMGYGVHQKGYRLLDLENKKFFVCRDVHFNEHVFPFQIKLAYLDTRNQVVSLIPVEDSFFDIATVIFPIR